MIYDNAQVLFIHVYIAMPFTNYMFWILATLDVNEIDTEKVAGMD